MEPATPDVLLWMLLPSYGSDPQEQGFLKSVDSNRDSIPALYDNLDEMFKGTWQELYSEYPVSNLSNWQEADNARLERLKADIDVAYTHHGWSVPMLKRLLKKAAWVAKGFLPNTDSDHQGVAQKIGKTFQDFKRECHDHEEQPKQSKQGLAQLCCGFKICSSQKLQASLSPIMSSNAFSVCSQTCLPM